MKAVVLGLCLLAVIAVSEAKICTADTECGSDECCYIRPMFLVASKKRQLSLVAPGTGPSKTGVCEKYRNSGDHCGVLETANGHCGCMSGTSCKWIPDPTPAPGGRRSMIYHPEPGSYKCA